MESPKEQFSMWSVKKTPGAPRCVTKVRRTNVRVIPFFLDEPQTPPPQAVHMDNNHAPNRPKQMRRAIKAIPFKLP